MKSAFKQCGDLALRPVVYLRLRADLVTAQNKYAQDSYICLFGGEYVTMSS